MHKPAVRKIKIRKCWILKGQMFEANRRRSDDRVRDVQHRYYRNIGEYAVFKPSNLFL